MRIVREGCAALPKHVHDGIASMPQCKTASTVAVVLVRREVQICNVALLWRKLEEVVVHCLSWSVYGVVCTCIGMAAGCTLKVHVERCASRAMPSAWI